MISAQTRRKAIELIDEAVEHGARQKEACRNLGIDGKTFRSWKGTCNKGDTLEDGRHNAVHPSPKWALKPEEEEKMVEFAERPENQGLTPTMLFFSLLDSGLYYASQRQWYRVLRKKAVTGNLDKKSCGSVLFGDETSASGPNQLWSWDITYLGSGVKGLYYFLYVIIDVYSRKIVAADVWTVQSAGNASELLTRAFVSEGLTTDIRRVLHSDNGATMRAEEFLERLRSLNIVESYSRPRHSNDNPFSESLFSTLKRMRGYQQRFSSLESARKWVDSFVEYYNNHHCHSGINYFTPNEAHTGMAKEKAEKRTRVVEEARSKNPLRWRGRKVRNFYLPEKVYLVRTNQKRGGIKVRKAN